MTFGWGPRFLHSTGQFHKGGPQVGRVPPGHRRGASDDLDGPGPAVHLRRPAGRAGGRRPAARSPAATGRSCGCTSPTAPPGSPPCSRGRRADGAPAASTNPLRDPRDRRLPRVPEPCALVVFGVTGDLARKKLIPAVYDLANRGLLPPGFVLLGFARRDWGDGDFEQIAREAAQQGRPHRVPRRGLAAARRLDPLPARLVRRRRRPSTSLAATLAELDASPRHAGNAAFYLSIPPAAFPTVLQQMQRTGHGRQQPVRRLAPGRRGEAVRPRPGVSVGAQPPRRRRSSPPRDVFRIDHYLGKETVQNLLALRFANTLFEPIWNSHHIDSVQITMAEDVGIGSRAGFYEQTGAARDVLQNHLLQLLALTAMEEPVQLRRRVAAHREAQGARARSRCPKDLRDATPSAASTTRAGSPASGSRPTARRRASTPRSTTETYAAVRLDVDTRRWAGRAVLPAHRQAAAATGHRDRRRVQEGAAPAVQQDRHRGARRATSSSCGCSPTRA